jgi:hypothetical protein
MAVAGETDDYTLADKYKCLVSSSKEGEYATGTLDNTKVYYIDPFADKATQFYNDAFNNPGPAPASL